MKLMKILLALMLLALPVQAAEINDFDPTDANNIARWPEGMTFANVNNAARADEGLLARFHKDINGSLVTTGSANTYAVSATQTLTAYYTGLWVKAKANFTNTGAATLNVDGLGAKSISNAGASAIVSGQIYDFVYDGTNFQVLGKAAELPTGTKIVFFQAACPTGWTQDATGNNVALRIVSGAGGGAGGTQPFTTAFASQSVTGTTDGTAISAAQMPAHQHFVMNTDSNSSNVTPTNSTYLQRQYAAAGSDAYNLAGSATVATIGLSSSAGSGATHAHTFTGNAINLSVSYLDVIICTRN